MTSWRYQAKMTKQQQLTMRYEWLLAVVHVLTLIQDIHSETLLVASDGGRESRHTGYPLCGPAEWGSPTCRRQECQNALETVSRVNM